MVIGARQSGQPFAKRCTTLLQCQHCVSKKRHPFYFYDNFVRCRPILLILDMIIGQSILQRPSAQRCSTWLPHGLVSSIVLSTRPSMSGTDGCTPVESWWTTLKSEHLHWAANFSFWLILVFYNFAKTSCLARCQILACITIYKVQLQRVKPGLVGWVT